jgi:hypothetical protein
LAEQLLPRVAGWAVYGGLAGLVGGALFGLALGGVRLEPGVGAALLAGAAAALAAAGVGFVAERVFKD